MDAKAATIPPNVPPGLVVDFDYNNPPGWESGIQEAWHRLHAGPDIFWTPHHGGHWVVTRAEDVEHIMKTYEVFSNKGMTIPPIPTPYRKLPLEEDPPESTPFRNLIQPFFLPKAIQTLEADARQLSISLIEGFKGKGECEFMSEFAHLLPIVIFLKMVNLPLEDRTLLLDIAERSTRGTTVEMRMQAQGDLMMYLEKWIVERQARPGNDLISKIVNATINGQPISGTDARGLLSIVVFGGLDTVASALGYFAHFLAQHPEHRRQLVEDPELIPGAIEELLRKYGVASTGRMLTRDLEYKGISFRKGDLVWVQHMMYGLDDHKYPDPLKIDFKRPNVLHGAFGFGVHRCPGSFLARTELKVFLQEWMKRIPDFRVKKGAKAEARPGSVTSMLTLPLEWDVR